MNEFIELLKINREKIVLIKKSSKNGEAQATIQIK